MAATSGSPTCSNPVVVFVPGAWHSPLHYSSFLKCLNHEGFITISERNPSCDCTNPDDTSTASDAAAIRKIILSQVDDEHEVVIVMHSYGGCPGAAAAQGLSKRERQIAGKPGGVIGLIFLCAFIASEGDSLISKLPGSVRLDWMVLHPDGQVFPDDPKTIFYEDVPSQERSVAISHLRLQSNASMDTPSPHPAWRESVFDGRRSYLYCLQDKAIPFIVQKMMVETSGVDWNVKMFDCAHSPFLSHTAELSVWVAEQVCSFIATVD